MTPSNIPKLLSPSQAKPSLSAVLITPMIGLTAHIITPTMPSPARGYNSTGLIPSSALGNFSHSFSNIFIIQPPMKPASRAPKKPDGTTFSAKGSKNVAPLDAIRPPIIPTRSPGRSAIDIAINPASIGSIKLNAYPPIALNHAAAGVTVPKSLLPAASTPAAVSIKNAIAIKIPPATTNGSI